MTTNPGHYHHSHNVPPSPSYISDDSEDHYGGSETDDPHPSSDSELVSHPSDNEDTPSPQRYDSDDTDDDDVDDGDDDDSHGFTGEQDAFLFVDPSDLDATSSRPPSALSHLSDHDPMKFVYPSMTLSQEQECERDRRASLPPSMPPSLPPSLPPVSSYNDKAKDNEDDVQELATTSSTATLTASGVIGTVMSANEKMEQPDSHDPSTAHDIPAALDSSLETISGHQQLSTEPSDIHRSQEQRNINNGKQGDDSTKDNNHYYHRSAYDNSDSGDNNDSSDSEHDTYTPPPPRTVQSMPNPSVTSFISRQRVPHANNDYKMAARTPNQDPSGGGNEPSGHTQVHASINNPIDRLSVPPTKTEIPTPPAVSGSPSPESNFVRTLATFTGLAGLVSLVIVGGCLALEFYYRSLQPAHVALSAAGVTYADDHRLAVVNFDVYSSRLRQERHLSRSPGFHARVLNDNNPWSLQDAYAQPLYLFADPIVVCPDGGSCQIYVASLQERHKKNSAPWLCHDTGYYVHLWFANGTRVPLSPPEIFTTRSKSDRKPLACLSPATFIGSHRDKDSSIQEDDGDEDYLRYWKERWQQMSGTVSNRFSNKSQVAVYWDPFQTVVARTRVMAHAVATYYKRATDRVAHMLMELKGRLACVDTMSNNRLPSTLDRARSNAKGFQTKIASKLHNLSGQIPLVRSKQEKARRQAKISMEEQARAFKKAVEDQFDSITADKILRVADDVLTVAEAGLEAILDMEAVRDLAKTMRADEIKRATERVVLKTEEQLDAILHSELARQVNRDLQRLVDDFKATPAGGKIVQEAQDIQSDAKRYIRSLQRKFRLIRLERF